MIMHIDNILQERGQTYGRFEDNAATAQSLKKVLHMNDNWFNLNYDQREALDMICSKMARIMNGDPNYPDNFHDIAGYATLVANRLK
jgi:hypothetical protein